MSDENGDQIAPEPPIDPSRPWWQFELDCDGKGRPHINLNNILRVLNRDPQLAGIAWHDSFHLRIFTACSPMNENEPSKDGFTREWESADDLGITTYMQGELKLHKVTDEIVRKAVTLYAKARERNEARDWMDSLQHDGSPRIDRFMSDAFGAEPSMYMRAVSKNFWLSLVARIYRPGCKVDNMIVLEGAQGIGKSRALAAIGGKWYLDWNGDIYDKDFFLALQGKLIVEFSELDSFGKSDVTHIKSVITCLADQYRVPYEARSIAHPRQCVFVGSTNEPEWIKDQTGGRRFWPVKCDLIDVDFITTNRDQLFAEAVARFKDNETWWEMPESTPLVQEERRVADPWEDVIGPWLASQMGELRICQVADECLKMDIAKINTSDQRRIAQCLRRESWVKHHSRQGNVWIRKSDAKTEPQINA